MDLQDSTVEYIKNVQQKMFEMWAAKHPNGQKLFELFFSPAVGLDDAETLILINNCDMEVQSLIAEYEREKIES